MFRNQKKYRLPFVVLLLVLGAALLLPRGAAADPIDDFTKAEQRLNEKAGQVGTLQDELDVLDEAVETKLAAVSGLRGRIAEVRQELDATVARLDRLLADEQAARRSLGDVVRIDYVEGSPGAWDVLAGDGGLSDALDEQYANGSLGDYANGLADDLGRMQKQIDRDRHSLVARKRNLEDLEAEADQRLRELEAVRQAKRRLLKTTQGQEDAYQKQYDAAREQLVKLGVFGKSGCSRVGSRIWPDDGDYFNQCDPRWSDAKLGFSDSSTLGDYGCGVTSLAMVYRMYGVDTDPLRMNQALRRVTAFWDDLLVWQNVSGAYGSRLTVTARNGADWSVINGRLDAGSPVIVYLDRGATNHYVVLLRRDGDDYRMNDPIEGPDQRFSDHYSTSAVQQYVTFRES